MAIVVSCKCGKKFKVKDELAGKSVKCPGCASPLRIPGGASGGSPAPKSSTPKVDAQAALLRFEEAQKKKQMSAEEEAAYREEHNKLVASYDQIAGKTAKPGEKEKKGELAGSTAKKPTIFTKLADAFGVLFGTFAFKYAVIAILAGAGVFGSVKLVQFIAGYMGEQTSAQTPREERIRLLFEKAEKAVADKQWREAASALDEIIQIDPKKDMHRDYQRLRAAVLQSGA